MYTHTTNTNFQRVDPFSITPANETHMAGHAGIIDHSV